MTLDLLKEEVDNPPQAPQMELKEAHTCEDSGFPEYEALEGHLQSNYS